MAIETRIDGAATFKRVAVRLREQGDKDISREMGKALDSASLIVQASIRAEADKVMPTSGGYRALLSKSLKFRISRRTGGRSASLSLVTFASGTKQRRDINALEAGRLRHPVFGRSRRIKRGNRAGTTIGNPWSMTEIRPGFHRRGTDSAVEAAENAILDVIEDYAARLVD